MIGEYVFNNSQLLETINIPENVEFIGQSAFAYCSSLKEITIPLLVETIDDKAFQYCTSLTTVIFTDGLIEIGNSVF